MAKHSKDQGQSPRKPKQKTKKSMSEGISRELQRHEYDTGTQSEASTTSQKQIDEGGHNSNVDSMVDDRSIEGDLAPMSHEWGSDEANLHQEAPEQLIQGPIDSPLPASDFHNDDNVFHHTGAHIHIPTHFDTRSTGYDLSQWSWEALIVTTQTVPLSAPSSYNASTAAIAYDSTHDSPITAIYSHPTTTILNDLPVTTQYQLGRWVYENRHDETIPTDRMEGYYHQL
ncbi:uncharacterized protein EAE97_005208 [Botrytis byssoidea]|uniref:Uncharacterized protein n=1 Tax=Botrytis byssoidea TaxID=139641 RepID=A0A9P5IMS8_9HELO|nr:uncharacterized protein EAE97_005208 [Botrytis byssoidea]KAF7944575.1 hypothetical protein EAE97_005208 [Botrytis byssoidea]